MRGIRSSHVLICAALSLLACSLVFGVAAAAAGARPTGGPRAGATVLKVGWTMSVDSLNPFVGFQASDAEVWALNYDALTRPVAGTMDAGPDLATSWTVSPDGKIWTFHLRSGVTWQDGVPFTALDVAWTYNFIIKHKAGAFWSYVRGIDRVAAVDDTTVVVSCARPKADMLCQPIPILPRHIWRKIPAQTALNSFRNRPPVVGTGPFQVVSKTASSVRLVKNPAYWGSVQPTIDEVRFFSYTNDSQMADDLKGGALDVARGIPQGRFAELTADPNLDTVSAVSLGYDYLSFNCYARKASLGNPVLRDPAFRRALNWAVDKAAIIASAYGGFGRAADTVVNSGYYQGALDWHWSPPPASAYSFDLDTCKQQLDAAGYTDTTGDGIRDRKGHAIALRLFTRSSSPSSQSAGNMIAGWLRSCGLRVKVTVMDDGVLANHIYNSRGDVFAPNFDMFIWGWYTQWDPDFTFAVFRTRQIDRWSDCNYSNAAYDSLYTQQQRAVVPASRKALTDQMQQILYTDSPYIPLRYLQDLQAYNTSDWAGWVQAPGVDGGVILTGTIDSYLNVHPKP
jgi:peptide/nickel transport system substrate-binding protein